MEPHAGRLGGPPPQPDAEGVLKTPLKVEVTVHHTPQRPEVPLGPALASARVQRWFSSSQLSRTWLQTGPLRGVFLLPSGAGGLFRRGPCGGFREYMYAS